MNTIYHPEGDRGKGEYGWLSTRYSFSFSNWYDPTKMGFGALRVLNDDVIAGGQGFATHGHRDMEIITIIMNGSIRHNDSMGNEYVVEEGDVQVMSAGTGVMHGEHNNSDTKTLELFQLWIEPKVKNIEPRYDQKNFNFKEVKNDLIELVGNGGLLINQDAYIAYGAMDTGVSLKYSLQDATNGVYVFVIEGSVRVGDQTLDKRDALGIWGNDHVEVTGESSSSFLVIEVPLKTQKD
jgi:redox-sensitive bicupin YhaK (pirin superfamily)